MGKRGVLSGGGRGFFFFFGREGGKGVLLGCGWGKRDFFLESIMNLYTFFKFFPFFRFENIESFV